MNDESRIDSILGNWRARRDAGEAVTPDEVVAAHPDLADSLRARFDALAALSAARQPSLRNVPPERYAEFRVLGQGGMGIVYWALDTDLNRQVAFKVVRPDAGQGGAPTPSAPIELAPPVGDTPASQAFATLKARFLQEAWVTAGLEHPGIVPVYEVGQTPEGVPYYTMRFVRGSRTLAAAIADVRDGPIDARLALLEPFLRVCDTIRYAHAHGVIHRDLKPDNVALGEFGEVVVLDWGLAKMTGKPDAFAETWQHRLQEYRDAADLRTMASALGTPGYMAPEAALGRTHEVDSVSDVYSLGAILFQILAGRLPYTFSTYGELIRAILNNAPDEPAKLDPSIPAELSNLCVRALSKNRESRPASVDAFAGEIREWLARRAADRELDALREQAKAAFDAASGLEGDLRLHQLDRAASACDQVLTRRADDPAAAALRREIDALRTRGVEEREHAARGRVARRAAVIGLAASLVGAATFAWVVQSKQRETQSALADAKSERDAKDTALGAAERERDAKSAALRQARGLALAGIVHEALRDERPARAVRFAREAVKAVDPPDVESVRALYAALGQFVPSVELRGHEDSIRSVSFSPSGRRLVTVSDDGTARVWDASGREIGVIGMRSERPFAAAAFETGTCVISATDDGTLCVRDAAGRNVRRLHGHTARVESVAVAARTGTIVTGSSDRTARVWNAEGACIGVCRGALEAVTAVAVTPDGTTVVTGSVDTLARVFAADGTERAVLRGHQDVINAVDVTPTGDVIAAASDDGTARLWSADGRERVALRGDDAPVRVVRVAADGSQVLTYGDDGTARLWSATGAPVATWGDAKDLAVTAALAPDASWAAVAFLSGRVRVRDRSGAERDIAERAPRATVLLASSADGDRLLAWRGDGNVLVVDRDARRVWEDRFEGAPRAATLGMDGALVFTDEGRVATRDPQGKAEATWEFLDEKVSAAQFVGGEERIAATSGGGRVSFWSAEGALLGGFTADTDADVQLVCSADGSRIVTTADERGAIWDAGGNPLGRFVALKEGTVVSANGDHILTFDESAAHLYDAAGRELAVLRESSIPGRPRNDDDGKLANASMAPTGNRIVTLSFVNFPGNGTATIWDGPGAVVARFEFKDWINGAAWAADGRHVVLWEAAGSARVIDAETGLVRAGVRSYPGEVSTYGGDLKWLAVVDPEADRFVTLAPFENSARVWDFDGRALAVLGDFDAPVRAMAFAPGGRRIATGTKDGTVRIWDLDSAAHRSVLTDGIPSTCSSRAVFFPDGSRLLTSTTWGGGWIWDTDGNLLHRMLRVHDAPDLAPVFAPDGSRVVVAAWGGGGRVFDNSGTLVGGLSGHSLPVTEAGFSDDGASLVTFSAGDGVAVLRDRDGRVVRRIGPPGRRVLGARFATDGRILTVTTDPAARTETDIGGVAWIVVPERDGALWARTDPTGRFVAMWSGQGGLELMRVGADVAAKVPGYTVKSLEFCATGEFATIRHDYDQGRTWVVASARSGPWGEACRVVGGVVSPAGDRVAVWPSKGPVVVWSSDGRRIAEFGDAELAARAGDFGADGSLAVVDAAGGMHRVDASGAVTKIEPPASDTAERSSFTAVRIAPEGGGIWAVFTVGDHFSSRGCAIDARGDVQTQITFDDQRYRPTAISLSPRGDLVVDHGRYDWGCGRCGLWTADGRLLVQMVDGPADGRPGPAVAVVSPRGDRIVTSGFCQAHLWDAEGLRVATLGPAEGTVRDVAFSPSGDRIATGHAGGTVRLWDVQGAAVGSFVAAKGDVTTVRFAPKGDRLLVHAAAPRAAFYAVQVGRTMEAEPSAALVFALDGTKVAEIPGAFLPLRGHDNTSDAETAAFGSDGESLLLVTADGPAIYGLDGSKRASFPCDRTTLVHCAFGPRGDSVLTASADRTATVWTLDGTSQLVLRGHDSEVRWIDASPQGDLYATACADGATYMWDAKGGLLSRFDRSDHATNRVHFSPSGDLLLATADGQAPARLYRVRATKLVDAPQVAAVAGFTSQETDRHGALLPAPEPWSADDIAAWRRAAWLAAEDHRGSDAIANLRSVLAQAPHDRDTWLDLGRALLLSGDDKGATDAFERGLAGVAGSSPADCALAALRAAARSRTGSDRPSWETLAARSHAVLQATLHDSASAWISMAFYGGIWGRKGAFDALDRAAKCRAAPTPADRARAALVRVSYGIANDRFADEAPELLDAVPAGTSLHHDLRAQIAVQRQWILLADRAARRAQDLELAECARRPQGRNHPLRGPYNFYGTSAFLDGVPALAAARRAAPPGPAVVIVKVAPGSQAEVLGLREGDLLLRLDDKPVHGFTEFINEWKDVPDGATKRLTVLREGREVDVTLDAGEIGVGLRELAPETDDE